MREAFITVFKSYALCTSRRRFLMRHPAICKANYWIPAEHTAGMTEYENIGSGRPNVAAVFGL